MGAGLYPAIFAQRSRWRAAMGRAGRCRRPERRGHGAQGSTLAARSADGQISLPGAATLQFDMVVVLPNSNARIYGGLTVNIGSSVITSPPLSLDAGPNPCGSAAFQGVSNAGILGLGQGGKGIAVPNKPAAMGGSTDGEGKPRDAPRLPTMARRELLVAGAGRRQQVSGSPAFSRTWTGVIAGGRIQPETICADRASVRRAVSVAARLPLSGPPRTAASLPMTLPAHALRRSQEIISAADHARVQQLEHAGRAGRRCASGNRRAWPMGPLQARAANCRTTL